MIITITLPDLNSIQSYVTLIKDILTGTSALIAAIIAIIGLRAWQNQLRGKNEYELATKFMYSTLKVREAFSVVRAPAESEFEIDKAVEEFKKFKFPIENDKQKNKIIKMIIYNNRMNTLNDAFRDLDSVALEAEILWGKRISTLKQSLRNHASKLYSTIGQYLDSIDSDQRFDSTEAMMQRRTIFAITDGSAPDPFADEINKTVDEINEFVRPKLVFEK